MPASLQYLWALAKWLVLAAGVGAVVGAAASVFGHVLGWATDFRAANQWVILLLPVAGLAIVWLYKVTRDNEDRGTNTVIASIQDRGSMIPFQMAPLIFVSTTLTHLCGGSAGREGAALQLGGSIAQQLGKLMRLRPEDRRIVILCGMSAGFSALFGTPMAAAIFSLEVTHVGVMHYAALVPCVTASLAAHFVARLMQVPPEVFPVADVPGMGIGGFLQAAALAAAVGLASRLFCSVLHKAEHIYGQNIKNPYLRVALAGLLIIGLTLVLRTDMYLGSGMGIIEEIFHTGETKWYVFLLKMLLTAVTLGAGFKGGEIVPAFTIGAALGCALAGVLGLPPQLAAACGMAGLFCGVTNSPITALLISFELFGYEGMPYYLVSVAVSYVVSGYHSLYAKQRILYSKTRYDDIIRPESDDAYRAANKRRKDA